MLDDLSAGMHPDANLRRVLDGITSRPAWGSPPQAHPSPTTLQRRKRTPDGPKGVLSPPVTVERWPPAGVKRYVKQLQAKGADGDRLLRMLVGDDAEQRVDLRFMVDLVKQLPVEEPRIRTRTADLRHLWRHYRGVVRMGLQDDPLLREETRQALAADLKVIEATINLLVSDAQPRRMAPLGITAKPGAPHKGDPVSRQAFWTRPMVVFVEYLRPILGSWHAAYTAVAHLCHLAFGYPDNPKLVERRILHYRRRHNK